MNVNSYLELINTMVPVQQTLHRCEGELRGYSCVILLRKYYNGISWVDRILI